MKQRRLIYGKENRQKSSYCERILADLDDMKKYIDSATSYYREYAKSVPILFEDVEKRYAKSKQTIEKMKVIINYLNKIQKQIANYEPNVEEKEEAILTKRPSKK